jgi:hypothetical protein
MNKDLIFFYKVNILGILEISSKALSKIIIKVLTKFLALVEYLNLSFDGCLFKSIVKSGLFFH